MATDLTDTADRSRPTSSTAPSRSTPARALRHHRHRPGGAHRGRGGAPTHARTASAATTVSPALLLLLMAIKFFTVVYVFMHLRFDKKFLTVVFYSGLVLAVAVYVAVLTILNVWSHVLPP